MTFLPTELQNEGALAVYAHYDRRQDLFCGLLKIFVFSWDSMKPLLTANVPIHEVVREY